MKKSKTMKIDTSKLDQDVVYHLVTIRDNHTCQVNKFFRGIKSCNRNNLHIHHIKPKSHGGDDSPDNLTILCAQHHGMVHALKGFPTRVIKLKLILIEHGVTLTQLSRALKVTQPALTLMLKAGRTCTHKAFKIRDYLKATTGFEYTIEEMFEWISL